MIFRLGLDLTTVALISRRCFCNSRKLSNASTKARNRIDRTLDDAKVYECIFVEKGIRVVDTEWTLIMVGLDPFLQQWRVDRRKPKQNI